MKPIPDWLNKSIVSWILYDVASSGYALMIPGVVFAVYYRQVICGGTSGCDAQWALLVSLALVVSGVLSPLLGAIADLGALRHRIFTTATLICCIATAGLYWVHSGSINLGRLLFFLAQTSYIISASLYDAYIPNLVKPEKFGQLSGLGWGLGYLGGIICFALSLPFIGNSMETANPAWFRLTFVVVAGFYFLVSLPALRWLPAQSNSIPYRNRWELIQTAYHRVLNSLRNWRDTREVFKFLLSYYLISDGVVTVLAFVSIYLSTQFGLSIAQILNLTLLFNAIAIPSTIIFGILSDRFSAKLLLQITLCLWAGTILLMVLSTHPLTPTMIAISIGVVAGSTQSLCRSIFARMIQANQASEMFGFHALVSKTSAVLGPLTFGFVSSVTNNQRLAMLSLLLFFCLGSVMLSRVYTESPQVRIKVDV